MILAAKHINDQGFIETNLYKISHNITNRDQLKIFKNKILKEYNESILIARGISDFVPIITEKNKLKTESLEITLDQPNFTYLVMPEPAFGSVGECIAKNLSMTTQIECHKVQSYFESIQINLMPIDIKADSIMIGLSEIRSNGIFTHVYDLNFTFNEDWRAECHSCVQGMLYLRNELSKLMKELYISKNTNCEYNGKIISDLEVRNNVLLKNQINILLSNALQESKVLNFEIVQRPLTGENGDET